MATTSPNLGYGNQDQGKIDQFNQYMRSQPWYAQFLQSVGQDPSHVNLSNDQKAQLVKVAQANGVIVDQGHNGQEIDNSGNFKPAGSSIWKKIAIGAGIGGLALTGLGAAGIGPLAGMLGAGAGAADAADAGLTAADAGATAADAGALSSGIGGEVASLGADSAGLAGGGGAIAGGAADAGGAFVGPTLDEAGGAAYGPAADAGGAATGGSGGGGLLNKVGSALTSKSTLGGIANMLGSANTAAGNNRLDQEKLGLQANTANISGNASYENELMNRAKEDQTQRTQALKDIYRQSVAAAPRNSPYDPNPVKPATGTYADALANLSSQGTARIAAPSPYNLNTVAPITPYTNINPANVQGATNTAPGTLSKVGSWLTPAIGLAGNLFGGQ